MTSTAKDSGLSEVQFGEVKKAFDLVDKDHSGSITRDELKQVMKALGADPSPHELERLMHMMDADHSNTIEWHEFLAVMSQWLKEDSAVLSAEDGKPSAEQERHDTHRKISKFFMQFSRSAQFDEVRSNFGGAYDGMFVDNGMSMGMDLGDGMMMDAGISHQQQEEKMASCVACLSQLSGVAAALNSVNPADQLAALQHLNRILSFTEIVRTPLERFDFKDSVQAIYDTLTQGGAIPRILHFLPLMDRPDVQWEAAKILQAFAPGPRIANSPVESYSHPSSSYCKQIVVDNNGVQLLLGCLQSPHLAVREQAVSALLSLCMNHPRIRDALLNQNALAHFTEQMVDGVAISYLKKLTNIVAVLCGATHPRNDLPRWEAVAAAGTKLAFLLYYCPEEEVLVNAVVALSYLVPGANDTGDLMKRFVELSRHPGVRVQRAVMVACRAIIACDAIQTNLLLQHGLLPSIAPCLSNSIRAVRLDALETVESIAGRGSVQAIIDSGVVPLVLQILDTDVGCRTRALNVLKALSWGSPVQIASLEYDQVLRDVYQHQEATYNFDMLRTVAHVLVKLVDGGQSAVDGGSLHSNPLAQQIDMESLDHLNAVLTILRDDSPVEPQVTGSELKIVDVLRDLLFHMKRALPADVQSPHVAAKKVVDLIARFYPRGGGVFKDNSGTKSTFARKQSQDRMRADRLDVPRSSTRAASGSDSDQDTSRMMKVKCFLDGDNRTIMVSKSISFFDLRTTVEKRYDVRGALLQYEDDEQDKITIDTQKEFERCVRRYEKAGAKSLKVFVKADKRKKGTRDDEDY